MVIIAKGNHIQHYLNGAHPRLHRQRADAGAEGRDPGPATPRRQTDVGRVQEHPHQRVAVGTEDVQRMLYGLTIALALCGAAALPAGSDRLEVDTCRGKLDVFTYKPAAYRDGPLIIVCHGVLRNAEEYRDHARELARRNQRHRGGPAISRPAVLHRTLPARRSHPRRQSPVARLVYLAGLAGRRGRDSSARISTQDALLLHRSFRRRAVLDSAGWFLAHRRRADRRLQPRHVSHAVGAMRRSRSASAICLRV